MLARGELQTIGATTLDEYRKHLEKDAALERRFQPIKVDEPTVAHTIEILKGLRDRYEAHHRVNFTDDALVAAANLADRYITDRLPARQGHRPHRRGRQPHAHPSHAAPPDFTRDRREDRRGPPAQGSRDRRPGLRAGRRRSATRSGSCTRAKPSRGRVEVRREDIDLFDEVDEEEIAEVLSHLDRHPRLQAHRGRDREAAPHGGRAAQADRRPERGHHGRRPARSAAPVRA